MSLFDCFKYYRDVTVIEFEAFDPPALLAAAVILYVFPNPNGTFQVQLKGAITSLHFKTPLTVKLTLFTFEETLVVIVTKLPFNTVPPLVGFVITTETGTGVIVGVGVNVGARVGVGVASGSGVGVGVRVRVGVGVAADSPPKPTRPLGLPRPVGPSNPTNPVQR